MLVLIIPYKDSNLFLIEFMVNCVHIKRLAFARRKFFKIVFGESGESATSTFSADIDSHSRLIFKIQVDEIPVPCIIDMCNTGFILFDSLFSEITLS